MEVLITVPFNDNLISQIKAVSPLINITTVPEKNFHDIHDDIWKKTEVLITEKLLPPVDKVPELRWIQFNYAGIDFVTGSEIIRQKDITVTNLSGASSPQMAEYVLTMLLAIGHKLNIMHKLQVTHVWPADRFAKLTPRELRGSTVGLVGYGSINRELARILIPFGVTILACKKNVMRIADSGYQPEGLGDPNGDLFTRLYPFQAIKSMIKECDFVVVAVPLTDETKNLIGEEELAAMKNTAYLIDVSRGGVVNNSALREALSEKKIAGAVMDVFEQEPLQKDNPLWDTQNLIITPHIAGTSVHYNERGVQLIIENLKRYLNNEPLLNTFNPDQGY